MYGMCFSRFFDRQERLFGNFYQILDTLVVLDVLRLLIMVINLIAKRVFEKF